MRQVRVCCVLEMQSPRQDTTAEWEEESTDRSVGSEGWGMEDVCNWPRELYLWPSVLYLELVFSNGAPFTVDGKVLGKLYRYRM